MSRNRFCTLAVLFLAGCHFSGRPAPVAHAPQQVGTLPSAERDQNTPPRSTTVTRSRAATSPAAPTAPRNDAAQVARLLAQLVEARSAQAASHSSEADLQTPNQATVPERGHPDALSQLEDTRTMSQSRPESDESDHSFFEPVQRERLATRSPEVGTQDEAASTSRERDLIAESRPRVDEVVRAAQVASEEVDEAEGADVRSEQRPAAAATSARRPHPLRDAAETGREMSEARLASAKVEHAAEPERRESVSTKSGIAHANFGDAETRHPRDSHSDAHAAETELTETQRPAPGDSDEAMIAAIAELREAMRQLRRELEHGKRQQVDAEIRTVAFSRSEVAPSPTPATSEAPAEIPVLSERLQEVPPTSSTERGGDETFSATPTSVTAEDAAEVVRPELTPAELRSIAIDAVIAHEETRGWTVEDVTLEERGFDLISRKPHPADPKTFTEVRFIVVQAREGEGQITLTDADLDTSRELQDEFWVYGVLGCAEHPRVVTIQNPARRTLQPVVKIIGYTVADRSDREPARLRSAAAVVADPSRTGSARSQERSARTSQAAAEPTGQSGSSRARPRATRASDTPGSRTRPEAGTVERSAFGDWYMRTP